MKTTRYFREDVKAKRPYLVDEWCLRIVNAPEHLEAEPNGRIRHWGFVPELGRYLRVVTLADGETVHNAFPDRDYARKFKP